MARGGQNHSKEKQCGFSCFIQVIFGVAHLERSQFSTAILMQAAKEEKKLGNCLVWDHLGHIRDVGGGGVAENLASRPGSDLRLWALPL